MTCVSNTLIDNKFNPSSSFEGHRRCKDMTDLFDNDLLLRVKLGNIDDKIACS